MAAVSSADSLWIHLVDHALQDGHAILGGSLKLLNLKGNGRQNLEQFHVLLMIVERLKFVCGLGTGGGYGAAHGHRRRRSGRRQLLRHAYTGRTSVSGAAL